MLYHEPLDVQEELFEKGSITLLLRDCLFFGFFLAVFSGLECYLPIYKAELPLGGRSRRA